MGIASDDQLPEGPDKVVLDQLIRETAVCPCKGLLEQAVATINFSAKATLLTLAKDCNLMALRNLHT